MAITLPKNFLCCILLFSSILGQSTSGSKSTQNPLTKLSIFWHVAIGGNHSTTATIIPPINPKKHGFWGGLAMIDNKLTLGADPKSTQIGLAQGFYAGDTQGLNDPSALNVMTLSFTSGEYNGSTISILGQNDYTQEVREVPVVGGTGKLRLTTGYAEARTYSFDSVTGSTVVELNITLVKLA